MSLSFLLDAVYTHFVCVLPCCYCYCINTQQFLCEWESDTHTHTRLTALFPGLPGWAGTRKVKPIWILLKQGTVSGSGISWGHMQVCTSLQTDNHASTPPLSCNFNSIIKTVGPLIVCACDSSSLWPTRCVKRCIIIIIRRLIIIMQLSTKWWGTGHRSVRMADS